MKTIARLARRTLWISELVWLGSSLLEADSVGFQKRAVVQSVASNQLSLDVITVDAKTPSGEPCDISKAAKPEAKCPGMHLVVTDDAVKEQLKQLHGGDYLEIGYSVDSEKGENVLRTLSPYEINSADSPFWVLVGSAGACLLLYNIFSGFRPWQLILGEDNRYSNSKLQMAVWFFVLITSYIAVLWLRLRSAGWDFVGGIDIPKNLLLLSGLSAITFAGAKGITANKASNAAAAAAAPALAGAPVPQKTTAARPNFFSDLTRNDRGQFDFGDFQMLVVTFITVVIYLMLVFSFLHAIAYSTSVSLPDVDTTILATFGLGQGAYLTKKAVGEVGT